MVLIACQKFQFKKACDRDREADKELAVCSGFR